MKYIFAYIIGPILGFIILVVPVAIIDTIITVLTSIWEIKIVVDFEPTKKAYIKLKDIFTSNRE